VDRLAYIDRFIGDIDASNNLDDVFRALQKHLDRLGFPRFSYWQLSPERGPRRPLFISSYPKEWLDRYVEQNYAGVDLVPRQAVQISRPFVWGNLARTPHITDSQRLVFNESNEFGLCSGASVPIHGPGKAKGILSVANDMKENEFNKLFLMRRHEVHLVATYAHEKILTFEIKSPLVPNLRLSPREIEILTWTAKGKTRWEISSILSLSEDTVKNHLDHCCQKLNVNNKTHAVAVAMIHALIWP
jgi:LuxR family transcriptional regulator, activator of conjugal transfer of Ti plasmids